ncbi:glucose-6-phosphate isomerase [bacterium CG_4_10_14_0_2_um_filter_33_32]|nr:MAG: glucose-6-phosphate isomerase [bacterium CG10_big_fil_rev_8_21_14_0_10_33_18]PIU76585.1 MAG: glucose-6-phosphate isomerase [bacterium CG06_land_8_20_14_3_00_33_50]PIW81720.1 MAG: glucose-6-phosphate isomerase [bacterium CG_4_8_14_3_um_filter_33_28]PIY85085.1 MAG: glucose-6-phosphate isomerase [bacterium CG_4_10_14_0_8_um_filter_33_57]PIZ86452.1 MAG: glucose-6-phosphate isomerase [bacterium CG_4_10_14_0_2_um_filter_33_32]PJA72461.1 MAG: glucose-6-phosphate isomerase [bacterium CG_4_9_14
MDLEKISGLPIREEQNKLVSDRMNIPEVDIRTIDQAQEVLLRKVDNPEELYYMYRATIKDTDKEAFSDKDLRYDITVIPSFMVGDEFNKTVGHYHPNVFGTEVTYPEIYEVLQGRAHYLLQRVDYEKDPQEVLDPILIEAKVGDKVIIPPGYGHVTINPWPETLIMSNISASNFKSIYEPYAKAVGAIYYETAGGKWVKNNNYKDDFSLRKYHTYNYPGFNISFDKPMYEDYTDNPSNYEFLAKPQDYSKEFEEYLNNLS